MFDHGPIDWAALQATSGTVYRDPGPDVIEIFRGRQVYMATPVTQYIDRGEAGIAIQLAAEAEAHLLSLGLSPVSPAILTVTAVMARGDDVIGLQLQAMDHGWWMRRCLPWMEPSAACVVPAIRGWQASLGVWQEASWFAARRRPVLLFGDTGP